MGRGDDRKMGRSNLSSYPGIETGSGTPTRGDRYAHSIEDWISRGTDPGNHCIWLGHWLHRTSAAVMPEWLAHCKEQSDGFDRVHVCDVRVVHLGRNVGTISVDGRQNGAIEAKGWDGDSAVAHILVEAQASSEAEAEALIHQVHVVTTDTPIHAEGPATFRTPNLVVRELSHRRATTHQPDASDCERTSLGRGRLGAHGARRRQRSSWTSRVSAEMSMPARETDRWT